MTTSPSIVNFSPNFLPSVNALQATEAQRVLKAVQQFGTNSNTPSLNLHPVHDDRTGRLYTFRASSELRVLAIRIDEGRWTLEEAGHHDPIYRRAKRGAFVSGVNGSILGFFSAEDIGRSAGEGSGDYDSWRPAPPPVEQILSHWTDAEMKEVGLTDADIAAIRAAPGVDQLLDLDIPEESLLLAIDMIEVTPETFRLRSDLAKEIRKPTDQLATAVDRYGHAWGFSDHMTGEELKRLLDAPIEKWMIFLHPAQKAAANRKYSGPARIGGPAGTGKSVVGLHRAAALARRFKDTDPAPQILFTTFIKSLPPYFQHLYQQMPQSLVGAVDFIHIDSLAARVCREHHVKIYVDMKHVNSLFDGIFANLVTPDSPIQKIGLNKAYVREEIDAVIRGRMTKSLDDYLSLERTGRKVPLKAVTRRAIWRIHEKFALARKKENAPDFIDVMETAVSLTTKTPPRYRAAIIDEAQDISLLALQFVRHLTEGPKSRPRSDWLTLIGDGAQRIYPSCYTLSQAGISVRGRSTTLTENYRNTRQILQAAMAVTGDREVVDLDSSKSTKSRVSSSLPPGMKPRLVIVSSPESGLQYLSHRITELIKDQNYQLGDLAFLVPTNFMAKDLVGQLVGKGLAAVEMRDIALPSRGQLRVGTFHRAKGLEFKGVFILGLESYPGHRRRAETDEQSNERIDLETNAVFVAFTRARETLELIIINNPSEYLGEGVKKMKRVIIKDQ